MAIEIERKFLVANDGWRASASEGVRYLQGYLAKTPRSTVRVRLGGGQATLTIKSARRGLARDEFSYPIPPEEADFMLQGMCGGRVLEKDRHLVEHDGLTWTVDVYHGGAAGLVVAEVELERAGQPISIPSWLGLEVSHDLRYRNSTIALWSSAGQAKEKVA